MRRFCACWVVKPWVVLDGDQAPLGAALVFSCYSTNLLLELNATMSGTPSKFQLSARKKAILDALLSQEGITTAEDRIPRRQQSGPAPLSFAQRRLWFFDQFEPASFAYNLLTAVSLRGKLDISALQNAFDEMARRHQALRTIFDFRDGQPVQIINEHHSIPLRQIEITHLSEPQ